MTHKEMTKIGPMTVEEALIRAFYAGAAWAMGNYSDFAQIHAGKTEVVGALLDACKKPCPIKEGHERI